MKKVILVTWLLTLVSLNDIAFAGTTNDYVENAARIIEHADINRDINAFRRAQAASEKVNEAARLEDQMSPASSAGKSSELERAKNRMKATIYQPMAHDLRPVRVNASPDGFEMKKGNNRVSVPSRINDRIKIINPRKYVDKGASRDDESNAVEIGLPNLHLASYTDSERNARKASDNSVVYLNYERNTDVAVQVLEDGVRILTILNGPESSSEYLYEITLPDGDVLKKDPESGGVFIYDLDGNIQGGFAPPWATDKDGKEIPTHFEIRSNYLAQIVNHLEHNPTYPVVADPFFGFDMIKSATWDSNYGLHQRLLVKPTTWARSWGLADTGVGAAGKCGWNELYSKYKNKGLTQNLGGMRDQYICHQEFAFFKSTWNLEVWRPDVSYLETILKACNPGPDSP